MLLVVVFFVLHDCIRINLLFDLFMDCKGRLITQNNLLRVALLCHCEHSEATTKR